MRKRVSMADLFLQHEEELEAKRIAEDAAAKRIFDSLPPTEKERLRKEKEDRLLNWERSIAAIEDSPTDGDEEDDNE